MDRRFFAAFAALGMAACSSSDALPSYSAPSGSGGSTSASPDDGPLAAPAPGKGVQYQMVSTLNPGQEIERCKFFVAPPEGLWIHAEDVRYTPGSHHVLLYRTPYDSIPTTTLKGETKDTSDTVDCAEGATADWSVNGVIGGAQSANAPAAVGNLPDGIAIRVDPGTVLLMDTHYLNASTSPVTTDARINVYTIPASEVTEEAGIIFFYDPFISVPAHSTATARMSCPVGKDITIVSGQSHMHRRGVGYEADLVDGTSGQMMEQLYTTTAWEAVPVKMWPGGKVLKAGTSIDYQCHYRNDEDHDIAQGRSTKDEMCMWIGAYYPRDPIFETCGTTEAPFDGAATWIGNGTTSCADSLGCLVTNKPLSVEYDACMTNASPSVAKELSAVMRCNFGGGHGMCTDACKNDKTKCIGCLQTACKQEIADCMAK